jgi:hypothetical protein
MSELKNQNFRLRIPPPKHNGVYVTMPEVVAAELILYSEFGRQKWLHFKYPEEEGFEPLTPITDPSPSFAAEITTEQSETAPLGNVVAQLSISVTDDRFTEGFALVSGEAIIYNIKDVIK